MNNKYKYTAVLLLGSNLGNTKKNLETAILLIEKEIGKVEKKSDFVFSDPVEFVSSNIFCNIALLIRTNLSPYSLSKEVKLIENHMGREFDSSFYGEYRDRVIDIDIVSFEGIKYECGKLFLPHHKHLYERAFSMEILDNLRK